MRTAAATLVLLTLATGAAAKIDPERLGAAHFVGHWSLEGPEGCADGDTLSFYATGIWAVTNGGGNPVEALGTWSIGAGALILKESRLEDPLVVEEAEATVDTLQETSMEVTITHADGRSHRYRLDRCP